MIKKVLTSTLLMPALAMSLYSMPVLASGDYHHHWSPSDVNVVVTNDNSATVINSVDVSAKTGGNSADGGSASSAGNGGSASGNKSSNDGGNGGNGGNAGNGGIIATGNAEAGAGITNDVNYNKTSVKSSCGCEHSGDLNVHVHNNNDALVVNSADVRAKTGWNNADGGSAGGAGDGGSASGNKSSNDGGNGGNGGNAGDGGVIVTGNASAAALVFNTVNTNVTRIRR